MKYGTIIARIPVTDLTKPELPVVTDDVAELLAAVNPSAAAKLSRNLDFAAWDRADETARTNTDAAVPVVLNSAKVRVMLVYRAIIRADDESTKKLNDAEKSEEAALEILKSLETAQEIRKARGIEASEAVTRDEVAKEARAAKTIADARTKKAAALKTRAALDNLSAAGLLAAQGDFFIKKSLGVAGRRLFDVLEVHYLGGKLAFPEKMLADFLTAARDFRDETDDKKLPALRAVRREKLGDLLAWWGKNACKLNASETEFICSQMIQYVSFAEGYVDEEKKHTMSVLKEKSSGFDKLFAQVILYKLNGGKFTARNVLR